MRVLRLSLSSSTLTRTVPDPSDRTLMSTRGVDATTRQHQDGGRGERRDYSVPDPASSTGGCSITLDGAEHGLVVGGVDDDRLAGVEFLPQDLLRERVFDGALDRTPQGPRTEVGVVALHDEHQLRVVGELEAEALGLELRLAPA